ncbi:DNA adenine methylase [Acidithiobacillus thiooxidans]|uniref:Uncharacterized protein n=1 Tax=Acidithiobacillus thiooxidans TaxID=930 RepID=A0A1C2IG65_ACITH|nr:MULTISPECIES: DNA adenine methylase [Acidithiobacillus]MBU2743582.1 DNA adenine methylase [Acidithiobacillus albertensis]MBU2792427.1 DNA adenine methylase [Acidithiobacillus thiooxidans]MBU2838728.1 DNA adenine methylase [Acidithiobacillus thiooxidans]MBU2843212.1 DNA adenine methylase [Acidithiobacillus thiooxidans]OCX73556.1 hypothetical protein A6P07_08420 [Acidithiobacillus thiooxidans]
MSVTPAFAWLGGKNRLRDRIVSYTVDAPLYVEPFAGALNVLLARPAKNREVVNDQDRRIVNFYRVLQDDTLRGHLLQKLKYTPYARAEFGRALQILRTSDEKNSVDRAWAFFVAQNQGLSGNGCNASNENNWGISKERDIAARFRWHVAELEKLAERLSGVIIENRDALALIQTWDAPYAVFYCDPPYVPDTRKMGHRSRYQAEMTREAHHQLIDILLNLKGEAILSGYRDKHIHQPLENAGWQRLDMQVSLHAAVQDKTQKRIECLWLSPGIQRQQMGLFA